MSKLDEAVTLNQLKHIIRDAKSLGVDIDYDLIVTKRDAGRIIIVLNFMNKIIEDLDDLSSVKLTKVEEEYKFNSKLFSSIQDMMKIRESQLFSEET